MKFWMAVVVLLFSTPSAADRWRAPEEEFAFSYGGYYLVKIIPGESIGDVFGFAGEPKGRYAEAVIYRYDAESDSYDRQSRFRLKNPMAPVAVILGSEGVLVTFDNWHNMGYGKVVVAYDKSGNVLVEKSLADVYSATEIEDMKHSASSIWWRCGQPGLSQDEEAIEIVDYMNSLVVISLKTGSVKIDRGTTKCED